MLLRILRDACTHTSTLQYSACMKSLRTMSDMSCRYVFWKSLVKRRQLVVFRFQLNLQSKKHLKYSFELIWLNYDVEVTDKSPKLISCKIKI